MRVAFSSEFACALAWWLRLADEGHDVRVWIAPRSHKYVGDGLVSKASTFDELLAWAKEGHRSGVPTVVVFDSSGQGEKADEARKAGLYVMGGGSFMDRLEKDRVFGSRIAEEAGCRIPPTLEFPSIDAVIAHARTTGIDTEVYFKTDRYLDSDATHKTDSSEDLIEYLTEVVGRYGGGGKSILQEKIEGVAISTLAWWDGRTFCTPILGDMEHKKFLTGEIGPATGCAFNATWWYPNGSQIADDLGFEALIPLLAKHEAPPGPYDINAIVDGDGDTHFLEWTPRFGYDSEMTAQMLIPDLGAFVWRVATGQGDPDFRTDLSYSLRLTVPPYPWEHSQLTDKHTCIGVRIREPLDYFIPYQIRRGEQGFEMASPEGIVGLTGAYGPRLSVLHDTCLDAAKEMHVSGLQFRTDGGDVIAEDAETLSQSGILDLPPGLVQ